MTKYLILFPSEAMQLSEEEFARAGVDSCAVIEQVKAVGVYVFGSGINESVNPVLVAAEGSVTADIYPGANMTGWFTVLELPTRMTLRNGRGRSPLSAADRRSFASSCTILPASARPPERQPCTTLDRDTATSRRGSSR